MKQDATSRLIHNAASVPYSARSEIVPSHYGVQNDISCTPSTGSSEIFNESILQLIGAENQL
ncbi:MAG: hypothetical protein RR234_07125, partial [Christensenella sp.]